MPEDWNHTHECRDCGGSIYCNGSPDEDDCWSGGNDGCEACEATALLPRRRAVIEHKADLTAVRRYLPLNYRAEKNAFDSIIIEGFDVAGWTLDGYVIPRLASGLYFAKEVQDA